MGEPDAATPAHIIAAADEAASAGKTHYAPNAGIPELREALSDKVRTINGLGASAEQLIVTQGAVQGIFGTLGSILTPGDDVLIPDPGWPNYRMMTTTLGARAISYPIDTESGQIDIERLKALATPRTRAILINTPSNPLGTMLSRETLSAVYEFAERQDLWIISDEVYDELVYRDQHVSVGALEGIPERVVSVYSFSKTYAMTGWRVGYVVAPGGLAPTLTKLQEPVISCVNTPAQYAALAAVRGPRDFIVASVKEYAFRADLAGRLFEESGVKVRMPSGAFYLWLSTGDADGGEVARKLVTEHGVAVAPGFTFGRVGTNAVRIALSASRETLRAGVEQIIASGLVPTGRSSAHGVPPHELAV
jgi:aspartate/methionine/tyrosine aminotransferase